MQTQEIIENQEIIRKHLNRDPHYTPLFSSDDQRDLSEVGIEYLLSFVLEVEDHREEFVLLQNMSTGGYEVVCQDNGMSLGFDTLDELFGWVNYQPEMILEERHGK